MPSKPQVRESDRGLRFLEEKLSVYVNGRTSTCRNPALDLLTGRVPDARREPAPVGAQTAVAEAPFKRSHPATVVLPMAAARLARAGGSPWLAPAMQPRVRLIAPPPPRPSTFAIVPRALAVCAVVALALGAGLTLRGLRTEPSAAVVSAAPLVLATQSVVVAAPTAAPAQPTPGPTAVLPIARPTTPPAPAAAPVDPFRLLVDEHFAAPTLAWPNEPGGSTWLAESVYHLAPQQPGRFTAVGVPGASDLGDVVLSGTFRKLSGPAGGGYGLIVRDQAPEPRDGESQEGRFYVFEVGDRGELGVWLRDGTRWVDLVPWTPSEIIKAGSNELTVSATGDKLNFLVNGVQVASQRDTLLQRGGVGLFVGGDGNSVAVERLTVRVPR